MRRRSAAWRITMFPHVEWPLVGREADLDQTVALVASGTGIAVLGPAGVGKSRLLHELVDRAGQDGMAVIRAVASDSTRSIPFAPFVELLPDGPTEDRLAMLVAARRTLAERRSQHGLLISVDDAHHLDDASLAFLVAAVESESAVVAMTARTGEPMRSDLVDMWTNGVISRIDLQPLSRTESRRLVETALGPLSPDLEEELWRLARGNPLLLHELIEGSLGTALVLDDGLWSLDGEIAGSARLADLVISRLRALPENIQATMATVALGSPLPVSVAESIAGDGLRFLEERGFVSVLGASEAAVVVPSHPLYGEVLAANLGESRRRSAYRQLLEASIGADSSTDRLRLAIWQSRSGAAVSREIAIAGAEEALIRHDPALAESLIQGIDFESDREVVILGRALSYQQKFAEAEEMLSRHSATTSGPVGELVSIRAQNLGFGLGRVDEARDLLETAAEAIGHPGMRARLNNERAMISAINGDFVDARSATQAVLDDDDSEDVARVAAYVTLTVALAMTADCDGIDDVTDDAIELAAGYQSALPFARDQIEIMQTMSLLNAGRIEDAVAIADRAIDQPDRGTALTTTWLSAAALCLDLSGDLRRCVTVTESALASYEEMDPFGLQPQTRGILALARGQMADPEADEPLSGLPSHPMGPRLTVWIDRGRAWAAAARGQVDNAAEIAVAGGRRAMAGEHYAWGALCFHDAVRLGRPELVTGDLESIDTSRGAHLQRAMTRHAVALASGDSSGLADVARTFGGMGAWLLAAEAWAQVTVLLEGEDGDPLEAARACALSLAYEQRCDGPDTPALRARPLPVTAREIEVAVDAAAGQTSPEIAERLFISARTVDNHLSSVYRKLDVSGREGLRELLDPSQ